MKHVFCYTVFGDPMCDREAAIIDTAIVTALYLRGRYSADIYVREVNGTATRMRGFADTHGWHWLVTCPKCKGAGAFPQRMPGAPSVITERSCTRCKGDKLVKKDED